MDLKKYKKVRVTDIRKLYFPPVLDYKASFAAESLCKSDLNICYNFLRDAFKALGENLIEDYPIMFDFISQGNKAFIWIVTFFKEIEKILDVQDKLVIPPFEVSECKEFSFPPPYTFREYGQKYRIEPINIKLKTDDVVNKYRVLYIKNCYAVTDFIDGYPSWYMLSDTTIFEEYNPKINRRIRIDCNRGEYLYFIAGASDNWQQIVNVPIEIDYVVTSLLFRN